MTNGYVYDISEVVMDGIEVLSCRVTPVPVVISGKTLGGMWFVQTVGTAAQKATATLRVTSDAVRFALLTAWATGAQLIVAYDDVARSCLILEEPIAELVQRGNAAQRLYIVTLTLAITAEEAL